MGFAWDGGVPEKSTPPAPPGAVPNARQQLKAAASLYHAGPTDPPPLRRGRRTLGGHTQGHGWCPPPATSFTAVPIPQLQGLESQTSPKPQSGFQVQIKPAGFFSLPSTGRRVRMHKSSLLSRSATCTLSCPPPQTPSWDPPMSGYALCFSHPPRSP